MEIEKGLIFLVLQCVAHGVARNLSHTLPINILVSMFHREKLWTVPIKDIFFPGVCVIMQEM